MAVGVNRIPRVPSGPERDSSRLSAKPTDDRWQWDCPEIGDRNVSGVLRQPHRRWNAWTSAGLPGGVSPVSPQSLDTPPSPAGSRCGQWSGCRNRRGYDGCASPTSSFFPPISDEPSCPVRLIHCNCLGYSERVGRIPNIVTKGRRFLSRYSGAIVRHAYAHVPHIITPKYKDAAPR
jgi:hypothetical protein